RGRDLGLGGRRRPARVTGPDRPPGQAEARGGERRHAPPAAGGAEQPGHAPVVAPSARAVAARAVRMQVGTPTPWVQAPAVTIRGALRASAASAAATRSRWPGRGWGNDRGHRLTRTSTGAAR